MPGPPPQHPHLQVLKGNLGKRKLRSAVEPSIAPQPPEPPPFLVGYAREEWFRLAPELHRLGLLTELDTAVLGAYCQAYQMWRNACELLQQMPEDERLIVKGKASVLSRVARMAADQMISAGQHFGLSPHSRLRLAGTTPPPQGSKFAGLIGSFDD